MGNKSGRTGKHILYYFALGCIIVVVNTVSCAPVQDKIAEFQSNRQLEQYRENLAKGLFETVIQHGQQVLEESETEPPADIALYSLGEVYANYDYEGRNYERSRYYFQKLIINFPDSSLVTEAKTYIGLFDTIYAKEREKEKATSELRKELEFKPADEKGKKSAHTKKVVENHNFEEAVQKNEQILKQAGKKKPADEALYNLGLIYAHVDNPAKDYKKSQIYFHVLTKQFPESEYTEEARIWLGLFDTIEKIQQIDIEIEQQKKQLSR